MSKSIIPPTGDKGNDWPASFVLPQGINGSLSDAGWKEGAEGFPQQTFLGASIRNFNVNAGFGDTTSSLTVQLVNDEYNKSDGTPLGKGDDAYHNGGTSTFSPYHDGEATPGDKFMPPVVGTPVFFKFGANPATVEQAFRGEFDRLYGYDTLEAPEDFPEVETKGEITQVPGDYHYLRETVGTGDEQVNTWVDKSALYKTDTKWRGKDHFIFGGILQSYTQNRGPDGNPLYSAQIVDPREILSNATVLLNNYAGTTYNNKNLINAYGYLEHDPSDTLQSIFDGAFKNEVKKVVAADGTVGYFGDDLYTFADEFQLPITGQGFARVSNKGMPWYRLKDALIALFNYNGALPQEYIDAGYGGPVDFRGYKYVVDFGGIPSHLIPLSYYINFDQIDLLGLAQELCDVISHDLFVSLLPIIDHPACKFIYDYNKDIMDTAETDAEKAQIIAGIIRIDAIDRTSQPEYGAIKSYLDNLTDRGIAIENQDLGYELSNVVTDKFVVGAQEIDMYHFSSNKDRDNLELRKLKNGMHNNYEYMQHIKWDLQTSLSQQILPFYGFLGQDKAVSIPRGFGSYQQIMLDTTGLNADGVGNYYIATELELRAALVSYEQWSNFLIQYDEVYISETSPHTTFAAALSEGNEEETDKDSVRAFTQEIADSLTSSEIQGMFSGILTDDLGSPREFGVTVPRCVFNSDRNYMGEDGYPASPCAPPYGYPLYYKRAEKIGIPQAGIVSIQNAFVECLSNRERLQKIVDENAPQAQLNVDNAKADLKQRKDNLALYKKKFRDKSYLFASEDGSTFVGIDAMTAEQEKFEIAVSEHKLAIEEAERTVEKMEEAQLAELDKTKVEIQAINQTINDNKRLLVNRTRLAKSHQKNAKKVYEFVKKVAQDNLGKKFLVKIPKTCNVKFSDRIVMQDQQAGIINTGPFGFRPQTLTATDNFGGMAWAAVFNALGNDVNPNRDIFEHYLNTNHPYLNASSLGFSNGYTNGALKCNFNPFSEEWEFNYKPEPQGGFFNFESYQRSISPLESRGLDMANMPPIVQDLIVPLDLTNIMKGSNRISCYARYNHSQYYDFGGVPAKDIAQQEFAGGKLVPDVLEELDNLHPDRTMALDQARGNEEARNLLDKQKASVAFVKCAVDEELYMPPKTASIPTKVWGRDYRIKLHVPKHDVIEIEDPDNPGCKKSVTIYPRVIPSFSPYDGTSDKYVMNSDFARNYDTAVGAHVVDTVSPNLDSDHVYALVTVPGRIKPMVDLRYLDGPMHGFNTVRMYNIMTRDVVKHAPGFDKPQPITNGRAGYDCDRLRKFSYSAISEARRLQSEVTEKAGYFGMDSKLSFTSPSPVFPDVVSIPLMSMERCYGPWLSSASLNPATNAPGVMNIGGRVEFVKDEKLAPWNFAGYQLMNEAGSLQAQFSNSLLLFSERGGFVIPEAPTGISLAGELTRRGPLVTSIAVDVGSDKISTTVQMDLYTSSFGKLQKQKEMAISQIARERQKIIDANNNAIRRGLGKGLANNDLMGGVLANGGQALLDQARATEDVFTDLERGRAESANMIVAANTVTDKVTGIQRSDGEFLENWRNNAVADKFKAMGNNMARFVGLTSMEEVGERASLMYDAAKQNQYFKDNVAIPLQTIFTFVNGDEDNKDGTSPRTRTGSQSKDVSRRSSGPNQ